MRSWRNLNLTATEENRGRRTDCRSGAKALSPIHQLSVVSLKPQRLNLSTSQKAISSQPSTLNSRALRVAIIGCGKVADQHVQAIGRISGCEIVALCDQELLMAKQLGERFGISECFSDLREMLQTAHPDVVHITTPPQSHFALAAQCLEADTHVYLEKPFTVTAEEAKILVALAQRQRRQLTAGHNYQFTLEMLEMRSLVEQGFLGGKPVHVESYWSYDLSDPTYVTPLLANRQHWVRR